MRCKATWLSDGHAGDQIERRWKDSTNTGRQAVVETPVPQFSVDPSRFPE
ncbi:hypothetical protein [Candidatus Paraluminiphilus aquimaris]|nr:hypothetical protein [Candidatus Paraluminiphilus aquimaris]